MKFLFTFEYVLLFLKEKPKLTTAHLICNSCSMNFLTIYLSLTQKAHRFYQLPWKSSSSLVCIKLQ